MAQPASHPVLIGLLGGECTGKTTLAAELTAHLPDAVAVPEGLRAFVATHGRAPLASEQARLMAEQRCAEDRALASGARIVVADPAAMMTAVYSRLYFGDDSLMAQAHADASRYQVLLWCAPDIPWVPDGIQRDGVRARAAANVIIKELLDGGAHTAVRLHGKHRVRLALDAISDLPDAPAAVAPLRGSTANLDSKG